MGEYLTLYTKVREDICNGRTSEACASLKKLLNFLNADYVVAGPGERGKLRKAIERLLPALQDLKTGWVSPTVVNALDLDPARFATKTQTGRAEPGCVSQGRSAGSDVCDFPHGERAETGTFGIPNQSEKADGSAQAGEAEKADAAYSADPQRGGKGAKTYRPKNSLSPLTFDDYVGQERVKRSLRITLAAAKKAGELPVHLLICSPYGFGKTTLANIIANEAGLPFFTVNAANLKDVRSVLLFFSKLEQTGIVFIDEIHTLKKEVQTALLSVMTEFAVRMVDEEGMQQTYEVPPFMLIGATTQAGELLKPFVNRFSVIELEEYTEEEEYALAHAKLKKLGFTASEEAVAEIVRRCRGVPRTIGIFAKGAADVALAHDKTTVGREETDLYFELQGIDEIGLTKNDLLIMRILAAAEKPLALVTLESKSGIQHEDVEYRIEPYLLKLGFIEKTERGRIITQAGREYVGNGIPVPERAENEQGNKELP